MTCECFSIDEYNLIASVKSICLPPPLSESRATHYLCMCPEGHPSEVDLACAINIPPASLCHANWCRGDLTTDAKSIHNCSFTLKLFLLWSYYPVATLSFSSVFVVVAKYINLGILFHCSIPFTALFRHLCTIKLHIHGCFTHRLPSV